MELGSAMMTVGLQNMVSEWMFNQSDVVQAAALSYAERLASEQFLQAVGRADNGLRPVLERLHRLYVLDCIERALGWYAVTEATGLSLEDVKAVPVKSRELCRQLAPEALALTDAFGFPDHMLAAPIATDWIAYNEYDNQGEVLSEKFD